MSEERLAAGLEATAFLRRAETLGGFGMILHKGDESRGSILLSLLERGQPAGFLDRTLQMSGRYGWARVGTSNQDSETAAQYVAHRLRADPDCWIIELDIPSAERFIAETTGEA